MKKTSLILHIVTLASVAALFILHFTSAPKEQTAVASESPAITAAKGEIVYIQLDTLINQFDMYNDLRSELEGKMSAIENDFMKKGRALENDIKSFQDKMGKGLLTRSQAETMGNELEMRRQELANLSQQKQMEMAEEERVMVNQVMDAIYTYVDEYNKTHEYSLILSSSIATNAVIAGNSGLNITQDILSGLNKRYIETRNK